MPWITAPPPNCVCAITLKVNTIKPNIKPNKNAALLSLTILVTEVS
jgi:hypothetical protein